MVKQDNIEVELKGDKLIITIDINKTLVQKAPLSSSGKNRLIASTRGQLRVNGGPVHLPEVGIGLNVTSPK